MFAALHRAVTTAGWAVVGAFFLLIFIGTGIAALYMYLKRYFLPEEAMGIIAVGAAVVGGIAILIAARPAEPKKPHWEAMLQNAAKRDPLGTALGALALGMIVESSPEIGRLINRLMGRFNL